MHYFYPMLVAFLLVFVSELGDKTQLLVLSFSCKVKPFFILFGVALGSFFSHGIAILIGSQLGIIENPFWHSVLQFVTYATFLLFGLLSFLPPKEKIQVDTKKKKSNFQFFHSSIHYIFLIAFSIAVGELGDKTFLSSLGLGIQYPSAKFFLMVGAIGGMLLSDSIAIFLGKLLQTKISPRTMQILSGILFICFGVIGIFSELFF